MAELLEEQLPGAGGTRAGSSAVTHPRAGAGNPAGLSQPTVPANTASSKVWPCSDHTALPSAGPTPGCPLNPAPRWERGWAAGPQQRPHHWGGTGDTVPVQLRCAAREPSHACSQHLKTQTAPWPQSYSYVSALQSGNMTWLKLPRAWPTLSDPFEFPWDSAQIGNLNGESFNPVVRKVNKH